MSGQQHIVHRHVLDVTLQSEDGAHELMSDVRRVFYDRLLPLLDETFSRLVPPDVVVRLDRLELDLGAVHLQSLEMDLAEALRRQLEEAVAAIRFEKPTDGAAGALRMPERDKRLAALMTFLTTGRLPWWEASHERFDPTLAVTALLDEDGDRFVAELRERATPAFLRRLAEQLDEAVLRRIAFAIDGERAAEVEAVRATWARLATTDLPIVRPITSAQWWRRSFEVLLSPAMPDAAAAFNRAAVEALARAGLIEPAEAVERLFDTAAAILPESDPVRRWITQQVDARRGAGADLSRAATSDADTKRPVRGRPADDEEPPVRTEGGIRTGAPGEARESDADDDERDEIRSRAQGSDVDRPTPSRMREAQPAADDLPQAPRGAREAPPHSPSPDDDRVPPEPVDSQIAAGHPSEASYITNAGLVLLWPFLGRFFKEIGFVSDGAFASTEAQRRAVLITQYLATGTAEASEHLLVLNKLLCGYPLEDPVERRIDLSVDERDGADELLKAVVTSWQALKNTSVDGFREAFLKRDGRLIGPSHEGWSLYIERRGYDVLLDSLPWGIGIVKQTWMPQAIYVEW